MKKTLLLFGGALCCFAFSSCSKNKVVDKALDFSGAHTESYGAGCGCVPADSSIFDATCLVAPNSHLKQLGEGFSFTEGPAVDKHGNIFFTDQPNDKI